MRRYWLAREDEVPVVGLGGGREEETSPPSPLQMERGAAGGRAVTAFEIKSFANRPDDPALVGPIGFRANRCASDSYGMKPIPTVPNYDWRHDIARSRLKQ
jgi:hypothetical protein